MDVFVLKNGFRDFVSVHRSCTPTARSIRNQCSDVVFTLVSLANLGFVSVSLVGKIHPFVRPPVHHSTALLRLTLALQDTRGCTSKALVTLTPFIGANIIAILSTMDYRHHWEDCTASWS